MLGKMFPIRAKKPGATVAMLAEGDENLGLDGVQLP